MNSSGLADLRSCLREPIPEIDAAAALLAEAVKAHLAGPRELVLSLLAKANMDPVRQWTESLWGKKSPYAAFGPYTSPLARVGTYRSRMPDVVTQRALHARDGFYCRFCGIPVVRKQVRERLRALYPEASLWGRSNGSQHAALQCMWAQYDHLIPYSRGGDSGLQNMVITCAPCNYGRMEYTLAEARLQNPLERAPREGSWDGLEQVLLTPTAQRGAT
jgi:HNH endonuclease